MNKDELRKLWLLFAQAVTLILAILFVIALFNPSIDTTDRNRLISFHPTDISFSRSLQEILPSVVSIQTAQNELDIVFDINQEYNIGSGVIVSTDGYILTNHHVISSGNLLYVITGAGRRYQAEIVGSDPETDIAVLKIETDEQLIPAKFLDQGDPLQVGDLVMSVGSPYGLASTASLGIVSAVGRNSLGLNRYEHFIQTDAAINHGSSGGALTNVQGELVGISTALFAKRYQGTYAQGIGFAIPVELAKAAYEQIIEYGEFKRGWIGLKLAQINPLEDKRAGIDAWIVDEVEYNSPSEEAGIQSGDLLIAINNRPPSKISYLEEATGELLEPGRSLELTLLRNDEEYSVFVTVVER